MGQGWWPLCGFPISSFSQHDDKSSTEFDYLWKERRWRAWDLNLGPMNGRPLSYGRHPYIVIDSAKTVHSRSFS